MLPISTPFHSHSASSDTSLRRVQRRNPQVRVFSALTKLVAMFIVLESIPRDSFVSDCWVWSTVPWIRELIIKLLGDYCKNVECIITSNKECVYSLYHNKANSSIYRPAYRGYTIQIKHNLYLVMKPEMLLYDYYLVMQPFLNSGHWSSPILVLLVPLRPIIAMARAPLCCPLHYICSVSKPRTEQDVHICKQILLRAHNNKSRPFKLCPEQLSNVLREWKVHSSVNPSNIHIGAGLNWSSAMMRQWETWYTRS